MDQYVSKWVEGSKQRRTQRMVGAPTQGGNDFGGRHLGAISRELVDRASHAATAQGRRHEHPKAVGEDADQMCSHRLDIPTHTQARGRQLRIVQTVDQIRDLAPLLSDSGKDELVVYPHSRLVMFRLSE
ncbi:hypothetical protein A5621_19330 [Mycobacterium colombiense]|nr:hypothetical protein A5621_19330 [Mycobacterium colombiense]OBJ70907.1 hypothetical protein A5627_23695 [Mycobacterium colombiense]